jgi:hypothetical protein
MSSISRPLPTSVVAAPEVSLIRLYLLQAVYLLIGAGLAVTVWPTMLHHGPWTLWATRCWACVIR